MSGFLCRFICSSSLPASPLLLIVVVVVICAGGVGLEVIYLGADAGMNASFHHRLLLPIEPIEFTLQDVHQSKIT